MKRSTPNSFLQQQNIAFTRLWTNESSCKHYWIELIVGDTLWVGKLPLQTLIKSIPDSSNKTAVWHNVQSTVCPSIIFMYKFPMIKWVSDCIIINMKWVATHQWPTTNLLHFWMHSGNHQNLLTNIWQWSSKQMPHCHEDVNHFRVSACFLFSTRACKRFIQFHRLSHRREWPN